MTPDLDQFRHFAQQYELVPVYRRLLSDALTPLLAFKLLDEPNQQACLFESVIGGEKVGRYSFIAIHPRERISAYGDQVTVERTDTANGPIEHFTESDPLEFLNKRLGKRSVAPVDALPPFVGGALGYASYDVVRYVENLPNCPPDDRGLPDLDFGLYDNLVVFDNVTKTMMVISIATIAEHPDSDSAYAAARQSIDGIVERLSQPLPNPDPADIELGGTPTISARSSMTREQFESAVRKTNEYIRAGDIFQVVVSQRFEVDYDREPLEIYRSLRVINPSPFMFFLRTPKCTLVGASPEVMCRVVDRVVTVRPLAGTRKRGMTEAEDNALAKDLLADTKERAEHVMLVDLGRNDIGRVAKFGTVELSDMMHIERYSHVMHISSNVDGILNDDMDAMDAMKACLPAGTVSGAPKVRAMEIIDEIEPHKRGPYAGAIGYFDYRGNMDTCIALRTMVLCNHKAYIQAGAGLVADSDPSSEYEETVSKSRAMLRAIEATIQRLG
jgi:anthranilate synthase component 1